MTRRRPGPLAAPPDPLAEALIKDAQGLAGDLTGVFDAIRGYDAGQIYGILYKKPEGVRIGYQGKYQWIEDLAAPFDFTEIYTSLKARFGGGDYRMTIMAAGKIVKQHEFSIFGASISPTGPGAAPANDAMKPADMLALMMTQAAEARRESQDQQRFFMEQQRAREAQFMTALTVIVPVVAPLLLGNREKLADVLALMQANRPDNNLKDTVETFAALKQVFGADAGPAGGGDFNPDDIVGSVGRLAGPILAAAGRAFNNGRGGGGQLAEPPEGAGDGYLHLPGPEPRLRLDPPPAPLPGAAAAYPLLDLLKPHVAYFFNAHLDPGLAAEAVSDIMVRAQVTDDDLNGLVAAFTLSADWLADLAAQGLDLRSNPAWASEFLRELVAAWNDGKADRDDFAGGERGAGDDASHARPGPPRVAVNADSGPGA